MTDDFWVEVQEAYADVAQLPQAARTTFLNETYRDRWDIRREVQSLLQYQPAADRLTQSSVLDAAATLFDEKDEDLIGTVIAGKYLVRRCLGAGNMGEVYLADHITLGIPFALKRPKPALRNDPVFRKRLLDEARRAVVLKHENVARVHDVLESGEDMFVVMEHIEGETLRSRLDRSDKRLSTDEFLSIAVQCGSALQAAHEKRIVHLDVKPENIMLTPAGQVKICDFGVARKLSTGTSSDATDTSEKWRFAGTPAYMSPEVILSYQFDERADQFSLGIVFYEMLTGRNPFLADTVVATTGRIVKNIPPPIRETNPEVDPKLERIVMRLLAKEPEDRYASTAELVEELEALRRSQDLVRDIIQSIREGWGQSWLKFAAAGLLLALVGLSTVAINKDRIQRWFGITVLPQRKIVVVLPFRVIGDSREEQFYSEGVSDILTGKLTELTTIPNLQVIPPSAIHDRKVDSVEKAKAQFGATIVLAGTFQFSNDQVRVSYSLIDPTNSKELRAGTRQGAALEPFKIQDALIRDVAAMLELELMPPTGQNVQVFGTRHPAAYFLYTEGRGALRNFHQKENIDTAIDLFTRATELDPGYAAAYAALGQSYWHKFSIANDTGWLELAEKVCEKAATLDQRLSQAHTCLGLVNKSKGDYDLAIEDFNRAIALEPTSDDAQQGLGTTLEASRHLDDAERAYRKAIESRSQYWAGYMRLASFLTARRHDYPAAIESYYKALAASPGNIQVYWALGGAYIDSGNYDKATSLLQQAVQLGPSYWQTHYQLGMAYLRARKYPQATAALEKAAGLTTDYRVSGSLSRIYALTGQSQKAQESYQLAINQGEKLLQLNARDYDVHVLVARYYAMIGKRLEALSHLSLALSSSANDPHYLVIAAACYLRLGDRTTTLNLMEQAIAHGATLVDIQAEPELDALKGDPRYIALISANQNKK